MALLLAPLRSQKNKNGEERESAREREEADKVRESLCGELARERERRVDKCTKKKDYLNSN